LSYFYLLKSAVKNFDFSASSFFVKSLFNESVDDIEWLAAEVSIFEVGWWWKVEGGMSNPN
jgi:hypothetical protein